jgi:hypothetical protein
MQFLLLLFSWTAKARPRIKKCLAGIAKSNAHAIALRSGERRKAKDYSSGVRTAVQAL